MNLNSIIRILVNSNGYMTTSTASARFNTAITACTKASTLVVNVIKKWKFEIILKYLNIYTIHFNYFLYTSQLY